MCLLTDRGVFISGRWPCDARKFLVSNVNLSQAADTVTIMSSVEPSRHLTLVPDPVVLPDVDPELVAGPEASNEFAPLADPELPIKIIRSARRKKTLEARVVGRAIEVRVPAGMDAADEAQQVDKLVQRVRSKHLSRQVDLGQRAAELADEFDLPVPNSIRWVTNQEKRFGSCTPSQGTIRISTRLVGVPDYVLDHVVLHELAHLLHPDHTPAFYEAANQHLQWQKAEGYLQAMSHGHAELPCL